MLKTVIEMANRRNAMMTLGSCRGPAAVFCSATSSPLLRRAAELEAVPTGAHPQVLFVRPAVVVPPLQLDVHRTADILAESDVDIGAALAGVTAAAVHPADVPAAVGRGHGDLGADRRRAGRRCPPRGGLPGVLLQPQAEERTL